MVLVNALSQTSGYADSVPCPSVDNEETLRPILYTPFFHNPPDARKQDKTAVAIFRAVDRLLAMQHEDGYWSDGCETNICTSMACLALLSVGDIPFAATNLISARQWLATHPPSNNMGGAKEHWVRFQSQRLRRQSRLLTPFQDAVLQMVENQIKQYAFHADDTSECLPIAHREPLPSFTEEVLRLVFSLSAESVISEDAAKRDGLVEMRKWILSQQKEDGGFGDGKNSAPLPTSLAISALMLSRSPFCVIDGFERESDPHLSGSPLELL